MIALILAAVAYAGTWTIEPSSTAGQVHLVVEYRNTTPQGNEQWSEGRDVVLSDELRGLSFADLNSGGMTKSFAIHRDAGDLQATGYVSGGRGAGTWTFSPSSSFNSELGRRGIGAANEKQQFELAMSGFKLSTLDELLRAGFERPTIDDIVSMADHGVSDRYIQEMKGLGVLPKSIRGLIQMRDHGVSSRWAQTFVRAYPGTNYQTLIFARDHGVSTAYVEEMAKLGYHFSLEDLIRLRDHGVSASYIQRLRDHGFKNLSVDDLIRLRDHGI